MEDGGWGAVLSDCEIVSVRYRSVPNRPSHFGFSVSEHADPMMKRFAEAAYTFCAD
jgi:hypothetical protein